MGRIKKSFTITLSPKIFDLLNKICKEMAVNRSEYIEMTLSAVLDIDTIKKDFMSEKQKIITEMTEKQVREAMLETSKFVRDLMEDLQKRAEALEIVT